MTNSIEEQLKKQLLTAKTLTLHWHDNSLPVYSVDFQPNGKGKRSERLATGGGDGNVRIWKVIYTGDDPVNGQTVESVEYLSNIGKHTQAVNCVRFNPSGEFLASASDDGSVMIWELSDKIVQEFGVDDEYLKESWSLKTAAFSPSSSEIYDISWSPDSKFIVCGSMDNVVRIFETKSGMVVSQMRDHTHYVQGVDWDPRNEFICSQSADRSIHIYNIIGKKQASSGIIEVAPRATTTIYRAKIDFNELCFSSTPDSKSQDSSSSEAPRRYLYKNETLQSFFRRLALSPDGSLLVSPCGVYKGSYASDVDNAVFIHTRAGLQHSPVLSITGFKKPAIAVRFSPVLYKLLPGKSRHIDLPYRMVFAVATQDSVFIYDTQRLEPLAVAASIHYAVITDVSWSADGKVVMASSADGFVSSIVIGESLLGGDIETYDIPSYVRNHPITLNTKCVKESVVVRGQKDGDNQITAPAKKTQLQQKNTALNMIKAPQISSPTPSIIEMLKISSEVNGTAVHNNEKSVRKPATATSASDNDDVNKVAARKIKNKKSKSGIDSIIHKTTNKGEDSKDVDSIAFVGESIPQSGATEHKKRRIVPTLISRLSHDK